ncbi:MAG: thiamine-phosphate kinase [Promethearchaeota archaeon]
MSPEKFDRDTTPANLAGKAGTAGDDALVEDVGERELIRQIWSIVTPHNHAPLALNDDAFVFPLDSFDGHRALVLNTDMLVGKTDVPRQMTPYQAGKKAVVMNASDLAVKGVLPRAMVVALGIPRSWKVGEVKELVRGMNDKCDQFGVQYLGGDLNESDDLVVAPSMFGVAARDRLLSRGGARPGDILVVNGELGLTGVGFRVLLRGEGSSSEFPRSVASILEPDVRIADGVKLAEEGLATASIDSSDGFHACLEELSSESGVGFEVDGGSLPVAEEASRFAEEFGDDPLLNELVFHGGEEFVHVFTIPPENWEAAASAASEVGGQLFGVGTVTKRRALVVKWGSLVEPLPRGGWRHWASPGGG